MSEPRPVVLTEGERRALRVMEEALSAEAPDLSLLLSSPVEPGRARRRLSRLLYAYVILSALLFLLGAGAADLRLQGFGLLMLLSVPVARPCIAELKRRWS